MSSVKGRQLWCAREGTRSHRSEQTKSLGGSHVAEGKNYSQKGSIMELGHNVRDALGLQYL